jgi:phosphatidylglycerol:prolipoprotein diacylglycerol transferase
MKAALLAYISYEPIQRVHLGPLSISPHGVGTAAGFLFGAMLMARAGERRGLSRSDVYNAVTWAAPGVIVGARGFYVLAHLSEYQTLRDVVSVWQGGLTMFGGFAGGIALGLLYMRRHNMPIATSMDAAAPGFVAGVMIGRIGDLIIADHLGHSTRFLLGYRIPRGATLAPGFGPPTYVPGEVVHQTALYDLAGALVLAGALALLARRRPAAGTLFGFFAAWYGLQRFGIDFTRNRELIESSYFGLSGSQWAGLLFAAIGVGTMLRAWSRSRARGAAPAVPEPEPVPEPMPAAAAVEAEPVSEPIAAAEAEPVPEAAAPEPGPPSQPVPAPPEEVVVPIVEPVDEVSELAAELYENLLSERVLAADLSPVPESPLEPDAEPEGGSEAAPDESAG